MTAPRQLRRRAWPGAILRSLGHPSWAAETDTGITFLGGRHQAPYSSWAGPAQIGSTLGFTTVEVPLTGGRVAKLAGVAARDAAGLMSSANEAFRAHFLRQFELAQAELNALSEAVRRLDQPRRLPAACLLAPFLARATSIIDSLPAFIPEGVLAKDQNALVETVRAFQAKPDEARGGAIQRFIERELIEMSGYFDAIEKNPLTPEQRGGRRLSSVRRAAGRSAPSSWTRASAAPTRTFPNRNCC